MTACRAAAQKTNCFARNSPPPARVLPWHGRALKTCSKQDPAEVANARSALILAQSKRDDAESVLNTLLNPDAAEATAKRYELAFAQEKRDRAAQDLQEIRDRGELQVALQEASVAAAQAKIDGENLRYEESTLTAPWDGYITTIPVETGQEVEPFEVILTVINSSIVTVEGSVDEIDVLSLRREEPVSVTIDALPDEELEGVITNISSTPANEQGVVTFDVTIRVDVPGGVTLQEGSERRGESGNRRRARHCHSDAVGAVRGGQGASVRKEDENGEIVEHPVALGSSDGFFTIVDAGLVEGDRIVMQGS